MTIHDEAEKVAKEYDKRVRIANGVWRAGLPRTTFGSETQAQHEATATLIRTLSARLKAAGARPAVRVKPLVWEEHDGKSYRQANCVLGQYQVAWLGEFECWQLSRPNKAEQEWKEAFSRHSNKDAAKAAAQADYETRILAAAEALDLTPVREALIHARNQIQHPDQLIDEAIALIDGEKGNG